MGYVEIHPYLTGHIVYDAPVDEKTKKVREMFKVDEKTGYPEHYNWRGMARLGKEYRPADPFLKFDSYDPKQLYSTKLFTVGSAIFISGIVHLAIRMRSMRPWWGHAPSFLVGSAAFSWFGLKVHEMANVRQGIRDSIAIDYTQKHPERFETIKRPKFREVLFEHITAR